MFYHAVPTSRAKKVLREALKPTKNQIFLAPTKDDAVYAASQWHRDDTFSLLEVNLEGLTFDGVASDGDNIVLDTKRKVPGSRLKLVGILGRY